MPALDLPSKCSRLDPIGFPICFVPRRRFPRGASSFPQRDCQPAQRLDAVHPQKPLVWRPNEREEHWLLRSRKVVLFLLPSREPLQPFAFQPSPLPLPREHCHVRRSAALPLRLALGASLP